MTTFVELDLSVGPIISGKTRNAAGGAVGSDTVSRVWCKTKGDWDAWNARSLTDKPIIRLILDGTVVRVEANRVADLCSRLVGNRLVRDQDGVMRPCRLGDIALLAPVGTQLWRFEEALEDRAIAVSTQAGKGFFHRQEIQDLIALTRTLADERDTLALAAPRSADWVDRSRVAGHRRSPSARQGPF